MSIERGVCREKLILNSTANTWATFQEKGTGANTRMNTGLLVAREGGGGDTGRAGGLQFYPKQQRHVPPKAALGQEAVGGAVERERERELLRW